MTDCLALCLSITDLARMRTEFYEGYEDIMENAFKRLSRTSKLKIKAMNYVDKLKFK